MVQHHTSISRACKVICLPKSMYYYTKIKDDNATILKLQELAEKHPTEGQDLYYSRIRREGLIWNYKRVRRVYLMLGMNRRRKVRKRIPGRVKQPLLQPEGPGETWSLDFMSDVLTNKRKFRTFNVIDDYNRQAIAVEVAHSMPATTVTRLLERITKEQGKPKRIRTDNGRSLSAKNFGTGVREMILRFNIYSRVGRCRMVISRGSIEHSEKIFWMPIYSRISCRYRY